jgi:succinate-acetate transporter protein
MSDIEKHDIPQRRCQVGNPAPLGLFAFASTTLVLSLFNVHARHVTIPNVVVGMALFYGGAAQFLAGMWEFAAGNTFGATAFSSYGAFWLSFATLFIPNSGIADAYQTDPGMEEDAIGIFLLAWMVVTFLFFIGSLRKSVGLSALFFFLTVTFLVLGAGAYYPYPQNFCRNDSLKQQYRLLKQESQHHQDRRILWHRHGPHRILLWSC